MSTLWRLVWALPLVLATGVGVMLLLKRFVVPMESKPRDVRRLNLRETLNVSDETRVHLVEIDRQSYLIVESTRNAVLQPAQSAAVEAQRSAARPVPAWARRLMQARVR
jgi:flagellar biogenesis protein FliO